MKYLASYTIALVIFSMASRFLLTDQTITYSLSMTILRAALELPVLALALVVMLRRM